MYSLSVKLQLTGGERSFDELHLQHRMDRARWWHVHSMCGRKVQGVDRINSMHRLRDRDVLYSSRGLSKLDMQRLSVKLQLACGEPRLDELRLQRGLSTSRSRSAC